MLLSMKMRIDEKILVEPPFWQKFVQPSKNNNCQWGGVNVPGMTNAPAQWIISRNLHRMWQRFGRNVIRRRWWWRERRSVWEEARKSLPNRHWTVFQSVSHWTVFQRKPRRLHKGVTFPPGSDGYSPPSSTEDPKTPITLMMMIMAKINHRSLKMQSEQHNCNKKPWRNFSHFFLWMTLQLSKVFINLIDINDTCKCCDTEITGY